MRFVRRLEKLTLWPNLVVLPQTSHLPATSRILPLDVPELDWSMLRSQREPKPRWGTEARSASGQLARPLESYMSWKCGQSAQMFLIFRLPQRMARVAIVTDSSADLASDWRARGHHGRSMLTPDCDSTARALLHLEGRRRAIAPPVPWSTHLAATFTGLSKRSRCNRRGSSLWPAGAMWTRPREARQRGWRGSSIEIVDSRSASLGLGFQVVRGAGLAQQGMSAPDDRRSTAGHDRSLSRRLFCRKRRASP